MKFLWNKIFGTHSEREIRRIQPIVTKINDLEPAIQRLSDDDLRAKTPEFKQRCAAGEELDALLPEAFAVVREVSRRVLNMRHFDVQLMGGILLHEGTIVEMVTGEGKTLVATAPVYLNALTGKGVHVITVNDYLARRDRMWMGPLYEFLGMSVGVIQHDMDSATRKISYACDITYGTNNEFGFDYLRDNMVVRAEDVAQRKLNYAIVDEVDSILIDEARTPLIISGQVERDSHSYEELKDPVEQLVRKQRRAITGIFNEAQRLLRDDPEAPEGYHTLLRVEKGDPKNKGLFHYITEHPEAKKRMDKMLGDLMVNKALDELKEGLFYITNEKEHNVELTDRGIAELEKSCGDIFTVQDQFLTQESSGDGDDKPPVPDAEFVEKSQKQHNAYQLLKAYVLYEKDTEYVVQPSGEVVIVDEFTGRLMPGRRWSDGLHQAVEAKEGVAIERASQTLATITFQNYFRMYNKLAGMTGTAATEANEFSQIYKLNVVVIPTNKPLLRQNFGDVIYKTECEKYNAICEDVAELYEMGRPVLIGTASIDKSERLSEVLKKHKIPHQVLNAKYHEMEAHIIGQAGRLHAVTIATNMAGRGTDIILGGNAEFMANDIVEKKKSLGYEVSDAERDQIMRETQSKVAADHNTVIGLGGLHVIGSERHESRRIDNQLRGRSGRQGDPGSSKFYLSLEDNLMRIFGSDRIAGIMERLGMEEGQDIQNPWITKAIETAQKRVETSNFEVRKHLLEYDNVMNTQREEIYKRRRFILEGNSLTEEIIEILEALADNALDEFCNEKTPSDEWDMKGLSRWCLFQFGLPLTELMGCALESVPEMMGAERVYEQLTASMRDFLVSAYRAKEEHLGEEMMRQLERGVMLQTIDVKWKDHLYELDSLREGIGLRAIGQREPLVEYKIEAFRMFDAMLDAIDIDSMRLLFTLQPVKASYDRGIFESAPKKLEHKEVGQFGAMPVAPERADTAGLVDLSSPMEKAARRGAAEPYQRSAPKVGRNAPCPCGSGKKYKKCCGQ